MSRFAQNFAKITVSANDHSWNSNPRHGEIQELFHDVFFVRGRMPSTPSRRFIERYFVYFSRTMTIIKHDQNQLTIVNSLRLNDTSLQCLEEMGDIKHIIRIGSFHGVDDAFYLKRYPNAVYWHVNGMKSAEGIARPAQILTPENCPIREIIYYEFSSVNFPEAILILKPTSKRDKGVLIACDSIQNHRSMFDWDNSLLVSMNIHTLDLVGKAKIGPYWRKQQAGIEVLRPQFESLLHFDWDVLIPGHGFPLRSGAKEALKQSIKQQLSTMRSKL